MVPVEAGAAAIEQVEDRIGVGAAGLQVETDGILLAHDFRVIAGAVDAFEFGLDVHLLQLVDQEDSRVAVEGNIGRRDLDLQRVVRSIAELFHDLAGLRSVFRNIGAVTRQLLQLVRRHAPQPAGRWLQDAADLALPLGDDVDKRLAVEAQRHRAPQFGIVEGRRLAVDDQVAVDGARVFIADRARHLALDVGQIWRRQPAGQVEFAGDECQDRGCPVFDDREFDAVEIGQARLPVIRVLCQRDVLVGFELDEFERTGADRLLAHLVRRLMAWGNRGEAACQQRRECRLPPLQVKRHLVITIGGNGIEVVVK